MILLESHPHGARRVNSPKIELVPRVISHSYAFAPSTGERTASLHFEDAKTGRCHTLTFSLHDAEAFANRLGQIAEKAREAAK